MGWRIESGILIGGLFGWLRLFDRLLYCLGHICNMRIVSNCNYPSIKRTTQHSNHNTPTQPSPRPIQQKFFSNCYQRIYDNSFSHRIFFIDLLWILNRHFISIHYLLMLEILNLLIHFLIQIVILSPLCNYHINVELLYSKSSSLLFVRCCCWARIGCGFGWELG